MIWNNKVHHTGVEWVHYLPYSYQIISREFPLKMLLFAAPQFTHLLWLLIVSATSFIIVTHPKTRGWENMFVRKINNMQSIITLFTISAFICHRYKEIRKLWCLPSCRSVYRYCIIAVWWCLWRWNGVTSRYIGIRALLT